MVIFLSAVVVMGETCQFPPDHPIQNLTAGQMVPVTEMERHRVYIYNRTFGDCRGCVRSLTFCYKPGSTDEPMAIEIRNPQNDRIHTNHTVRVDVINDFYYCAERYNLSSNYCCVNQELTAPFMVQEDRKYALNSGNTGSPLLHQNDNVSGTLLDWHGSHLADTLYKPLFYFTIDSSSGRLYAQSLHLDTVRFLQ